MVFANQCRLDRWRQTESAERTVLVLGSFGQGVGLAGDLIARAATEAGWSTNRDEQHTLPCAGRVSAVALRVWRGGQQLDHSPSDVEWRAQLFDLVVALDPWMAMLAVSYLKPAGRIVSASECVAGVRQTETNSPHSTAVEDTSQVARISRLLGLTAAEFSWPVKAWRRAILLGLRPRDLLRARRAFASGWLAGLSPGVSRRA